MNIFFKFSEIIKTIILEDSARNNIPIPSNLDFITVEKPPIKFNSDLSTNVAMVLSKYYKKSPLDLGEYFKSLLIKNNHIDEISVVKPGFINIKLKKNFWNIFLKNVLEDNSFGMDRNEKKLNFLIEFVSANPTGPLHVGHCRGAVLGDVISNLLLFNNHKVTKEYYVNDYGNQIYFFTKSVYYRIREIIYKEKFPIDDKNLYPGVYLIDIANNILSENNIISFENFDEIKEILSDLSIKESLKLIQTNLSNLGIKHNNFVSENEIIQNKEIEKVINKLESKSLLYQGELSAPERKQSDNYTTRKQLLFKSTIFGDDKDRALQKSDNSWTYFASDAAYHNNKVERDYDRLINIFGSDHTGYVKRITSVVEALSGEKEKLICKVSQLVKLIKDGKPFKMSKRKGDYITIEDLVGEVGKDATRFIMLNRSSDVELDFDFAKVKEKSKDNPVYYVQYCYARISSVFRNSNQNISYEVNTSKLNLNYTDDEIKIFRKIAEWPLCILLSSRKLEPHRLTTYLYELSSDFHSYWNLGIKDKSKRFIDDNNISDEKIILLKSISKVVKTGMDILGVDTPIKM